MRLGISSADKIGEVTAREQEDELLMMAEGYRQALEAGECFVHVRAKQSSNRDLKMLSQLTGENKFHRVNLVGAEMESVITNSAYLAGVLDKA